MGTAASIQGWTKQRVTLAIIWALIIMAEIDFPALTCDK